MPIHDLDPARIHIADLMAEADLERLVRDVRDVREPRAEPTPWLGRLALTIAVVVVLAMRAVPGVA